MFNQALLTRVIDLQERSYRLLKWVNQGLKSGCVQFAHVHRAMSAADAAEEWIRRHFDNVPAEARPREEDVPDFSRLFASYLTTSFELSERPGTRLYSYDGCYCTMCSYLASADYLKTKSVTPRARQEAVELKRVLLRALADALGLPLLDRELEGVLQRPDLASAISLAAYAQELLRRSRFAGQGEAVLALWREIAWEGTAPKKGFRLSVSDILEAEGQIVAALRSIE